MNTQQLESFIQVAENLNFARAAEVLNITQSAVSRQIHSLEEELSTKLFIRSTRTVALTPTGMSFLDDAKDILAKLQMAALKIEKHTSANIDILSIGCINDTYLNLLSKILSNYRQTAPQVHPLLRVIPSRSILNLFFNGEMDILFGFENDVPRRDGIHYEKLADIPICCAVPADHPFSHKDGVAEQELLNEHIIICNSYEIPSEVATIQHEIGRQVSPESINYCENALVSLTLVKAGYGISILPRNISSDFQISYVPISNISPMSYGVFYKTASKNHLIRSFLEAARKLLNPD
ncbi:MAG: LysR family transcriptional regulator [Lachnospiraceae bacterium]